MIKKKHTHTQSSLEKVIMKVKRSIGRVRKIRQKTKNPSIVPLVLIFGEHSR